MSNSKQPQRKFDLLTYFEIIDRHKVAYILQGLMAFATGLIGALLAYQGIVTPGYILLGFCGIVLLLILVLWRGHLLLSLAGMLFLFPVVLTVLMIEGEGLHDPGMLGFGFYVIVATLLMGKRFLPISLLVSAVSVVIVYIFEVFRLVQWTQDMRYVASFGDLIIILIILSVGSGVFWVVMNIIELSVNRIISSERQVKDAYDLTLEGWARALEMRDKETEGHSRRVTDLTLRIGRNMGFTEEDLFHLRRGALLHDIGKMAIPDSILNKPGELTEEEWEVIRQHPLHAYEMLKDIDFLEPAIDIPLHHHEQWDGKGYPHGLAGAEIPLAARIFAVVDNWDALLSERPYRPAWTQDEVVSYINEEVGKKFDPDVVRIFFSVIEES
jgi:putative nucleotidyltransferase with HDIG domain